VHNFGRTILHSSDLLSEYTCTQSHFLLGWKKNRHSSISWLHVSTVVDNRATMRPICERLQRESEWVSVCVCVCVYARVRACLCAHFLCLSYVVAFSLIKFISISFFPVPFLIFLLLKHSVHLSHLLVMFLEINFWKHSMKQSYINIEHRYSGRQFFECILTSTFIRGSFTSTFSL
jgi:hypothetical protein